jgi:hypothetical protein
VLRIWDVYPGYGSDHFLVSQILDPDPDPTGFRIWILQKAKEKIKLPFSMQKEVKIEVIFQTKFNLSCFSPFLKVKS